MPHGEDADMVTPCGFACGDDSGTADPVQRLRKEQGAYLGPICCIRWGRDGEDVMRDVSTLAAGTTLACWYCERTWRNNKYNFQSRAKCQQALANDEKTRTLWRADRQELITRKAAGLGAKRAPKDEKRTLTHTESRQQKLIKPKAKFWLMPLYEATFGNPRAPANKKKGHKVSTISGYEGVIVPPPPAEQDAPWDLEISLNDTLALDSTLETGDDENGDNQGEVVRRQYHDLRDQADAAFEKACVGTPNDALMAERCAHGRPRTTTKRPAGRARQVADASSQPTVVNDTHADAEAQASKRLRGVLMDSDDEVAPAASDKPRRKGGGKKPKRLEEAPPATTPADPTVDAAGDGHGVATADVDIQEEPVADSTLAAPTDPDAARKPKRGPKKKDLAPFSESQLQIWVESDKGSACFDVVRGPALLRSIARFETIQQRAVAACSDTAAGRADEILILKRLQVVSMGIKLCLPSKSVEDCDASLAKFLTAFRQWVAFCEAHPAILAIAPMPVQARYFDAVCNCEFGLNEQSESVTKQLQAYCAGTTEAAKRGLVLGITACLRRQKDSTVDVTMRIRSGLRGFSVLVETSGPLRASLTTLDRICAAVVPYDIGCRSFTIDEWQAVVMALNALPRFPEPDPELLQDLLVSFPAHGNDIVSTARHHATIGIKFQSRLDEFMDISKCLAECAKEVVLKRRVATPIFTRIRALLSSTPDEFFDSFLWCDEVERPAVQSFVKVMQRIGAGTAFRTVEAAVSFMCEWYGVSEPALAPPTPMTPVVKRERDQGSPVSPVAQVPDALAVAEAAPSTPAAQAPAALAEEAQPPDAFLQNVGAAPTEPLASAEPLAEPLAEPPAEPLAKLPRKDYGQRSHASYAFSEGQAAVPSYWMKELEPESKAVRIADAWVELMYCMDRGLNDRVPSLMQQVSDFDAFRCLPCERLVGTARILERLYAAHMQPVVHDLLDDEVKDTLIRLGEAFGASLEYIMSDETQLDTTKLPPSGEKIATLLEQLAVKHLQSLTLKVDFTSRFSKVVGYYFAIRAVDLERHPFTSSLWPLVDVLSEFVASWNSLAFFKKGLR